MNEQLSNEILKRIDDDQITPWPCWRFFLLRGFFWLLALLSVIVGSLAVGAVLFLFADYHRHNLPILPHSVTEFLLMMPYVWAVVFLLFVVVTRASVKHIRQGYRYQTSVVVSASVVLSILFGFVINFVGVGEITHEYLNQVPVYNYAMFDSRDAFSRPTVGRLAGIILSVKNNCNFSIIDFNGQVWQVHLATSTDNSFVPEASSTVQMLGLVEASSSIFIASSIREWGE